MRVREAVQREELKRELKRAPQERRLRIISRPLALPHHRPLCELKGASSLVPVGSAEGIDACPDARRDCRGPGEILAGLLCARCGESPVCRVVFDACGHFGLPSFVRRRHGLKQTAQRRGVGRVGQGSGVEDRATLPGARRGLLGKHGVAIRRHRLHAMLRNPGAFDDDTTLACMPGRAAGVAYCELLGVAIDEVVDAGVLVERIMVARSVRASRHDGRTGRRLDREVRLKQVRGLVRCTSALGSLRVLEGHRDLPLSALRHAAHPPSPDVGDLDGVQPRGHCHRLAWRELQRSAPP